MNTKIEVDPKLFITCRLCLEDLGHYQIAPAVKDQISYCFDINVEPYDGLPQLICKKCEAILCTYTETKKKFIEKQNDLKSKIQTSHNVTISRDQPETVSPTNVEFESQDHNLDIHRKRKACISSSSSDLEYEKPIEEKTNENYSNDEIPVTWSDSYTKQYVCRICNAHWMKIKSLKNHIIFRHSGIKRKYGNYFKIHCEVELDKCDGKNNITGSSNKVVLSTKKIIQNINPEYYIQYSLKASKDGEKNDDYSEEEEKSKAYESSDSSDTIVAKRKRTKRLCSRSSNETVVLDTANKSNTPENFKESRNLSKAQVSIELNECINIDDSSDSESENCKNASKTNAEKRIPYIYMDLKPDCVTIKEIISSCQNKYMKKHQDNLSMKYNKSLSPFEIATQLKRKILSIGRKIINKKKSVNCTPLLRFMENKNLDVAWLPKSVAYNVSQESNYVRIMTRSKNIGENVDNESGWTDYISTANQTYAQFLGIDAKSSKNDNSMEVSRKETNKDQTYSQYLGIEEKSSKSGSSMEASLRESNKVPNGIDNTAEIPSVSVPDIALADSAVLISDANLIGADTHKLLNANPVANPKQLPKKSVLNDTKTANAHSAKKSVPNETKAANAFNAKKSVPNETKAANAFNAKKSVPNETKAANALNAKKSVLSEIKTAKVDGISKTTSDLNSQSNNDTESYMPIITSTISLAAPLLIQESNSLSNPEITTKKNDDKKSDAPRIKVKPAAELMSMETLSRMQVVHEPVQIPCVVSTNQQMSVQNENSLINMYVSEMSTVTQQIQTILQPNTAALTPDPAWKNDFMILDTTELPNTTTNSPFEYFRKLLKLHNITLLNTNVELSNEFHCLIKFKVLYKQETNNQPVILCLALYCSRNVFCLKVKDRNHDNINLSRVSCNWQWEVLKIYKGEVVNKLLNNAQKIGPEVFQFTNSFLCLLKSINLVNSSNTAPATI